MNKLIDERLLSLEEKQSTDGDDLTIDTAGQDDRDCVATRSGKGNAEIRSAGRPDTLWSHLWYGLGVMVVIAIPPLVPGFTLRGIIAGYIAATLVIYSAVCTLGIVKQMRLQGKTRRKAR